MLCLLELWIEDKSPLSSYQYGAIKDKGCTEAWNHVWNKIIPKPWILEFDLSKCFDSIKLTAVIDALERTQTTNYLKY